MVVANAFSSEVISNILSVHHTRVYSVALWLFGDGSFAARLSAGAYWWVRPIFPSRGW